MMVHCPRMRITFISVALLECRTSLLEKSTKTYKTAESCSAVPRLRSVLNKNADGTLRNMTKAYMYAKQNVERNNEKRK